MNNHRGKLSSYNSHLQVVEIIASAFFYSFSLFTTVPRVQLDTTCNIEFLRRSYLAGGLMHPYVY